MTEVLAAVVGPSSAQSVGPTGQTNLRSGNQGELIVGQAHGRSYEAAYRQTRFGGAMQAVLATATIAGLNVSITGTSVLANPYPSNKNLVIERVGIGFVLAPAAPLAYGIATGFSQTALSGTLTSLNPKSKLIGSGAAPTGLLYASAAITLPVAPTVDTVLGVLDQGAVTVTTGVPTFFDLGGSIILAPGAFAVFWTSAVLAASAHIMSWEWEEAPV